MNMTDEQKASLSSKYVVSLEAPDYTICEAKEITTKAGDVLYVVSMEEVATGLILDFFERDIKTLDVKTGACTVAKAVWLRAQVKAKVRAEFLAEQNAKSARGSPLIAKPRA